MSTAQGTAPAGSAAPGGSLVATRPTLDDDALHGLLASGWGMAGVALVALPSERDQNARVDVEGRPRFVLKVANPAEAPAFLDAQDAVLRRLTGAGLPVPAAVPTSDGRGHHEATIDGRTARVRLFGWLDGTPIAGTPGPRDPALARQVGDLVGRVSLALAGLVHPGADRPFQWDLLRAEASVRASLDAIDDLRRRAILARRLDRLGEVRARVRALPRSIVHNDANDHNLLVADGRIAGLLDVGDLVSSVTAADAAVAATYLALGQPDPVEVIARVAAGAHARRPFAPDELDLLVDLVLARASISVAISARQARLAADPYLRVSEAPMWGLLERLDTLDPDEASEQVRAVCA